MGTLMMLAAMVLQGASSSQSLVHQPLDSGNAALRSSDRSGAHLEEVDTSMPAIASASRLPGDSEPEDLWLWLPLSSWGFMSDLATIASFVAIVIGVYRYWRERGERTKATHYRAWRVVADATGLSGSGGRIQALQDLARDGVVLNGVNLAGAWLQSVDLSPRKTRSLLGVRSNTEPVQLVGARFEGADLTAANLTQTDLRRANLSQAHLTSANLEGANLEEAVLQGAFLYHTNLKGARLTGAVLDSAELGSANLEKASLLRAKLRGTKGAKSNFQSADLEQADFQGAYLREAILRSSNLRDANLSRVDLVSASLDGTGLFTVYSREANLMHADLRGAMLDNVTFQGADLRRAKLGNLKWEGGIQSIYLANIADVQDAPDGFLSWAMSNGAVALPWKEWQAQIEADKGLRPERWPPI